MRGQGSGPTLSWPPRSSSPRERPSLFSRCRPCRFSATRRSFVLSIARDKDIPAILRILVPLAAEVVLTAIYSPRCMDLEAVAARVRSQFAVEVRVQPDPWKAVEESRARMGKDGLVCVTGSLYLVGAVREAFRASA